MDITISLEDARLVELALMHTHDAGRGAVADREDVLEAIERFLAAIGEAEKRSPSSAPSAMDALAALFENEHLVLGDLVYVVRERECKGWDGPSVSQWSGAVERAAEALRVNGYEIMKGRAVKPTEAATSC